MENSKPVNFCARWLDCEDQFIRDNAGTLDCHAIAMRLGRTSVAVVSHANLMGVSLRKTGESHHRATYSKTVLEKAFTMKKEGHKTSDIAKTLDINIYSLYQILRKGSRKNG